MRRKGEGGGNLWGQVDRGHIRVQMRTKGSEVAENQTLVPGSIQVRLNRWGDDPY